MRFLALQSVKEEGKVNVRKTKYEGEMDMKKLAILISNTLVLLIIFSAPCLSALQPVEAEGAANLEVLQSYGKLPLSFVENRGQRDSKVCYYLNITKGTINFAEEGITYVLLESIGSSATKKISPVQETESEYFKVTAFSLKPIDGNRDVGIVSKDKLPGMVNHLKGRDKANWHTGIPTYKEIIYQDLYQGIDLKVYGTNSQMEYDFIVSPGADPATIKMAFEGIEALKVDKEGNLLIKTPVGELTHFKPIIYQEIDGKRTSVEGAFKLAENTFAFHVGDYDKKHPLIIDPLTLSYSTFLGGDGSDYGRGIAVDSSGHAYVTGETLSAAPGIPFPLEDPYQGINGGNTDAFVTKFNPEGNTLIYSTYFGGLGDDSAYGIAVDSFGNAHIVGETTGTGFPVYATPPDSPYQGSFGGGGWDAFVAKFNAEGSGLVYSTFLGGTGDDYGRGIALDSSGNSFVTGYTSGDFPTTVSAYQEAYGEGSWDTFVTKFNPGGNAVAYSTYLGGTGTDKGRGVAVDSSGQAYVTGYTYSSNFPTQNPYQAARVASSEVFVTKFNADGSGLLYSTYLGGGSSESGYGVAVDSSGNCYVTGRTKSGDFPTESAYQGTLSAGNDVFVTKFNPGGNTLAYSTYLGGSGDDEGYGIAVDSSDNAYVVGITDSWTDFPTKKPYQGFGGAEGDIDAFVTKFSASGTSLYYSTYLGGNNIDYGNAVAVDASGNAYVAGYTVSPDFPVENAYQEALESGSTDVFVTKLVITVGLALDDATSGLWYYYKGNWEQLGVVAPEWLCAYDDKLVVDYGSAYGLKQYDGVSWTKLGKADPDNTGNTMVAYGSGVAVDYGSLGLWYYNGSSWKRLGTVDPEWLCVYGDKLVVDYGSAYGLYEYDGASWTRLGTADPDNTGNTMVAYGTGIAVDYGSAYGLRYYNGSSWKRLGTVDPEWLCAYGDNLVVDYGTAYGLKQYDGASWKKLGTADPDNTGNTMVAYDTGIVVDYGSAYGLKYYNGSTWTKLGTADPEWLCAYSDKLVGDYGGLGLWEYDGSVWTEIGGESPDNPDNTGNTMVEADL